MTIVDPFFDPDVPEEETPEETPELAARKRGPSPLWVTPDPRPELTPVQIRLTRECHFKRKPDKKRGCARCGRPKKAVEHLTLESFNVFGSGANRFAWQAIKQRWEGVLTEALDEAGLPRGLGRVVVEGLVCFPTRTPRDQGNFRVVLEKALGDCLQTGGWIANDDWDHYEFGNLQKTYVKGEHWLELMLFPAWPDDTSSVR